MKHLFFATSLLCTASLFSQNCQISGRIKNLEKPADTSFSILFMKGTQIMDSLHTHASGQFNKTITAGTYDIEISTPNAYPVVLRQVALEEGDQDVNISLKFNNKKYVVVKAPRSSGDSVRDISYFYIPRHTEDLFPLTTPAFMRRPNDLDFASAYPMTYSAPVIDTITGKKLQAITAYSEKQSTEIIAFGNWYMAFYPNPASGSLHIRMNEEVESIVIRDLHGKVLFESRTGGQQDLDVDISKWYNGIYMISATKNNQSIRGKLVVKH